MVAELARGASIEDVDLDAMNLEELEHENLVVKAEIEQIEEQLSDESRKQLLGSNYEEWSRRARWALMKRKQEQREIKLLMSQRQLERNRQRKERSREQARQIHEKKVRAQQAAARARRAAVLAAVGDDANPTGLLLRLYAAFRRLAGDGEGFPPELIEDDRATLSAVSVFLRDQFGSGAAARFRRGEITPEGEAES